MNYSNHSEPDNSERNLRWRQQENVNDAARISIDSAPSFILKSPPSSGFPSEDSPGEEARQRANWGPKYTPPLSDTDGRCEFRRICDDVLSELEDADGVMQNDIVTDEGSGLIAEIDGHLERLYDCRFGDGESLKSVVVALQFQLSNVRWTKQHIELLKSAFHFLRRSWTVTNTTADEIIEMIDEQGLDIFRGSVSEPDVVTRYRIEKIQEQ